MDLLIPDSDKERIETAIAQAELKTSGEIRVHIDEECNEDVLDHAAYVFQELEMHKTAQRNGVLFYVSLDHKFAILGDAGINAKVPEHFWEEARDVVLTNFKAGKFAEGLEKGIALAGEKLAAHFPYQTNDVNELSNEVTFGKK